MSEFEKYLDLEQKLLEIRIKNGPTDSEEEDNILDEMDEVWWNLSSEEQDEINAQNRVQKFWAKLEEVPAWQDALKKYEVRKVFAGSYHVVRGHEEIYLSEEEEAALDRAWIKLAQEWNNQK